jgi:hypothetical protein
VQCVILTCQVLRDRLLADVRAQMDALLKVLLRACVGLCSPSIALSALQWLNAPAQQTGKQKQTNKQTNK